ncbi:MAG: hypothetical protein Q9211_006142 [Gyalolechia sp. 1 TL-2023]
MLEIRRNLAVVNSCPAVSEARAAEDVDVKENPWRHGFDEIDMLPDDRLTNRILMDIWKTTQHAARLEEWLRGFGTQAQQPSIPGSNSTVRPPPHRAAEVSTTPTPATQQTMPRQQAPYQLATGQATTSRQPGGHGRGQSSASTQQPSGPGLPVLNPVPNHLLPLLIPQLAYAHPSSTQWGRTQHAQVRHNSRHQQHQLLAHQSQPSGFQHATVPQHDSGSIALGSVDRGRGCGQVRSTLQPRPPHQHPSHRRQPPSFAPGSATRGGGWQRGAYNTGLAGQSYGHHPQNLHHMRPHPYPSRGAPYATGMPYGSGPRQHPPPPSRGAAPQGPMTRGGFRPGSSHIATSNPRRAPSQPEGTTTARQAIASGLATPPIGSSREGEAVEQAAAGVERLHISNRDRG